MIQKLDLEKDYRPDPDDLAIFQNVLDLQSKINEIVKVVNMLEKCVATHECKDGLH